MVSSAGMSCGCLLLNMLDGLVVFCLQAVPSSLKTYNIFRVLPTPMSKYPTCHHLKAVG